ncbi:MAG: AraC family transcriptional regulator [Bacteroidales bacterium]|nr:AraC family transcriptional regulator [Bacteroidales bacterium]
MKSFPASNKMSKTAIFFFILSVSLSAAAQKGDNPFLPMTHKHYREYIDHLERNYGSTAVEENDSAWAATAVKQMYEAAKVSGDKKWELEARFLEFQARYFRELDKIKNDHNAETEAISEVKKIGTQAKRAKYVDLQIRVEYFIFCHCWHQMENHEKAFLQWDNVEKLLLAVDAEDFQLKPYYFTRIATLHIAFDQYEKAICYYKKALESPKVIFEQGHWEWLIHEFGLIYRYYYKDLDGSDSCFRLILETVHDTVSFRGYVNLIEAQERIELWKALAKGNLGANHFLRGEYNEAIPLLIEGMEGAVKNNTHNNAYAAGRALDLAYIYVKNNNLPEAIRYANKALEWLNTERDVSRAHNINLWNYYYHICLDYYRAKGDHANAWLYNDSLEIAKNIAQEEYNLQHLHNAEKQIAQLESEQQMTAIRQQRTIIIGLTFVCAALVLIVWLVVWSRRRIAEKNRGLYLQIKEQDSLAEELKQLRLRETLVETQYIVSLPPQNGNTKQQQLVAQLHEYLVSDKNFAKIDIDHREIAAALATNKTYLFEAVKSITGKTLQEYINYLRLDEAKKMLDAHSKFTMEAIAMECGFNTYRTFYRLFKEKYKLTPTEYGKLAKKEG